VAVSSKYNTSKKVGSIVSPALFNPSILLSHPIGHGRKQNSHIRTVKRGTTRENMTFLPTSCPFTVTTFPTRVDPILPFVVNSTLPA
jgi:hypothetical protein